MVLFSRLGIRERSPGSCEPYGPLFCGFTHPSPQVKLARHSKWACARTTGAIGSPTCLTIRSTEGDTAVSAQQVLDLIGNTPLVEVTRMDAGPCRLFLKMESQNPGGSIKDRIGHSMIEAAEKDGSLKPGGTIVEATAGNTGLGLALVATLKGYKLILIVPDKMSREKIFHLKAMGAQVMLTRSDVGKGHPEYYQDIAERISKETGAFFVNQFGNPANPLAHETSTGPEIWAQMEHDVDAVVFGVGSSGTMT
ncbi:MAG: cysteine synthase family protein, partial [Prolixibacteraceae bacterium]|nr:cysteine synthase family protein [Burkholderiales bacterium]